MISKATIANKVKINKLDDKKKKTFVNRTIISVIVLLFYTVVVVFSYLSSLSTSSWVSVLSAPNTSLTPIQWSPFDWNNDITGAGIVSIFFCLIVYFPLVMCLIDANNLIFKEDKKKSLWVIILVGSLTYFVPLITYIVVQYFGYAISGATPTTQLYQTTFYVVVLSVIACGIIAIVSVNILMAVLHKNNFQNTITLNFLIAIIPLGFFSFVYVGLVDGWVTTLMLLYAIAGTDVFCYVSGLLFGRTKMAPVISPNKTWEGAIGGIILTTALILGFSGLMTIGAETKYTLYLFIGFYTSSDAVLWITLLLLSAALITFSILGDLLFSYIKRAFKTKDFSTLLKSHGGFLDRFDSLIITSSVFFIYTFAALAVSLFARTALA